MFYNIYLKYGYENAMKMISVLKTHSSKKVNRRRKTDYVPVLCREDRITLSRMTVTRVSWASYSCRQLTSVT